MRAEFYATYDVMTGVRIAATLGAFFSLMVFLIVWKSRNNSNETLKALKVSIATIVLNFALTNFQTGPENSSGGSRMLPGRRGQRIS